MSTISYSSSFFTTPSFYPESSLDTKARHEYERGRCKAHKGHHDGRKKSSNTSSTPSTPKRTGLGHGNAWKNSIITLDDMEDLSREYVEPTIVEDESISSLGLFDKENSKPSPRVTSVSLEELVRSSGKTRKSQTRISLSRQASMENLTDTFPSLGITSPTPSLLPPISESGADLSLDPMQPFSLPFDYDDDDDASFTSDEFSPPGADDWSMDMVEDGVVRFTNSSDSLSSLSSSSIIVESSGW